MIDMSNIFTPTGLHLPQDITEDEFYEVGKTLQSITVGLQWSLGDWYNSIPHGDKQAACEKSEINYNVAKKCSRVCKIFPNEALRLELKFTKLKLLAEHGLTEVSRESLIEKTRNEKWTGKVLKLEINHVLGIEEPVHVVEFEMHGDNAIEVISTYMPKSASKKLQSAINKEVKKLIKVVGHDFYKVVEKEVEIKVAKDRARMKQISNDARDEKNNYKRLAKGIQRIITEDEFKLIRSCLHPDKHNGDDRYRRAFEAFNRMADKFQ